MSVTGPQEKLQAWMRWGWGLILKEMGDPADVSSQESYMVKGDAAKSTASLASWKRYFSLKIS